MKTLVFVTPIYYYEMSGQMKTLLDRLNPLYPSDYKFRNVYMLSVAADDEAIGDSSMTMKIGDTKVNVDWEDNQAVEALRNMAEDGDVTIQMSMYGGFEQVGSIGQSLPRDDKQITTSSGDVVLYSGNQMVVFYGSNSWSYTRLGHISDKNTEDMTDLLSNGDVTITISIE